MHSDSPSVLGLQQQSFRDDVLGLTIHLAVYPSSPEPYRLRITRDRDKTAREHRFDSKGWKTGSSSIFDDPDTPPFIRVIK